MQLSEGDFHRAKKLSLNLRLEDDEQQLVHEIRGVELELQSHPNPKEVLLQLNIRLNPDG